MGRTKLLEQINELMWSNHLYRNTLDEVEKERLKHLTEIEGLKAEVTRLNLLLLTKNEEAEVIYEANKELFTNQRKQINDLKDELIILNCNYEIKTDIINSLVTERDSFKEESENYKRLYFEQRHAKEQAEIKKDNMDNFRTGIEKLIKENGLDGKITVHIYTR